ncbi:hypothetical protein COLO4_16959 [Corchorus olitorius]|uniref:Uncharacterized protein n=1 Tax=Corchorus olitorius TaxID=93759 RepID=A0A1R3JES9_9ROSI|nr:hypothetical protein COLO4_16959 [Corchorus olitorius]
MVLWEITLGTAYFLGLRRTYRLALKIQRRIISPKHPKIRQFAQRRTRAVFDVALNFHQKIQQRDLEVGRNLGNWILRWLDKMKPSAQIRASSQPKPHHHVGDAKMNVSKQVKNPPPVNAPRSVQPPRNGEGDRHLFSSSANIWPKSFPTISMMMRRSKAAGNMTQYRHLHINAPDTLMLNYSGGEGFIRKDIMEWMVRK